MGACEDLGHGPHPRPELVGQRESHVSPGRPGAACRQAHTPPRWERGDRGRGVYNSHRMGGTQGRNGVPLP